MNENTIAKKTDWDIEEMPMNCEQFTLTREFSEEQMKTLRLGHIPKEMEDKWFWYMEGDTLFAHRSWSGICIYKIEFQPEQNNHLVTVNRQKEQYSCESISKDLEILNRLLDWWTQSGYDPYGEWISETVDMIYENRLQ